jgi:kinesin family protein 13
VLLLQREDLHAKLSESEKLMKEISQTWEEKLEKTGECCHLLLDAQTLNLSVQTTFLLLV